MCNFKNTTLSYFSMRLWNYFNFQLLYNVIVSLKTISIYVGYISQTLTEGDWIYITCKTYPMTYKLEGKLSSVKSLLIPATLGLRVIHSYLKLNTMSFSINCYQTSMLVTVDGNGIINKCFLIIIQESKKLLL